MAYELRDQSGSLWPNEKTKDTAPDWKGNVKVGGVEYRISAWEKPAKDGRKWLSLAFDVKNAAPATEAAQNAPSASVAAPRAIPDGVSSGTRKIMEMDEDPPF